jgi:hypothetical protein
MRSDDGRTHRPCHPGRRNAAIRDGGRNPMTVPEAASAAIRGKGQEGALVAALLPAQPCGLSGRWRGVSRPVPALPRLSPGFGRDDKGLR